MVRRSTARWARSIWFRPALTAWFLLPILFQTLLGFQSELRWSWELAYGLLTACACAALGWGGKLDGWWAAVLPLVCGAGGLFCENPVLGIALLVMAAILLAGGGLRWWGRLAPAAALLLAGGAVVVQLAVLPLRVQRQYILPAADGAPGRYAAVTVVDPGAMGRVRYHAVEQDTLLDLSPLVRIGAVTGRDSAASGQGRYGYVVDHYFETGL